MAALWSERNVHKGSQKKIGRDLNTDSIKIPCQYSRRGEAGVRHSRRLCTCPHLHTGSQTRTLHSKLIDLTVWGESFFCRDTIAGCAFNDGKSELWIKIRNLNLPFHHP